ncbi:MAG TPA: NAD(P)-dependent alcohol dehydrogenase [Acetobacteraceae bacterium]|nr:NAD(P)-dependent alcohol dehydrogenase [Acetobacteraceae bacterium]
MRVYRFPATGRIEQLVLGEEPARTPGPGEVRVRLRAAALNYRDLMVAEGRYGRGSVPANLVPLSDGAGEVAETGPGVTRFALGARVAGTFFQGWLGGEMDPADHAKALGGTIDGVLAEERIFPEDGLVAIPEHLSFEEAAALPCAALTAWNALFTARPLHPGETVLTLGTGGVSTFAAQFAHAAGARVIATSSSDAKLGRMRELGATDGLNYRTHPDWEQEVWRLTEKRGVDHVVEVGGAGTLSRSIASARLGGAVHLIGVLTGGEIDPAAILRRSVTVRGVFVGSREMFEAMNRMIALHRLRPVIDRVFPFTAAEDAYRHLKSAGHIGKVVIRID